MRVNFNNIIRIILFIVTSIHACEPVPNLCTYTRESALISDSVSHVRFNMDTISFLDAYGRWANQNISAFYGHASYGSE
jgi:hypothetical protein